MTRYVSHGTIDLTKMVDCSIRASVRSQLTESNKFKLECRYVNGGDTCYAYFYSENKEYYFLVTRETRRKLMNLLE